MLSEEVSTYVYLTASALALMQPNDLSSYRLIPRVAARSCGLAKRWAHKVAPNGGHIRSRRGDCGHHSHSTPSHRHRVHIGPPLLNYTCYVVDDNCHAANLVGIGLAREYVYRPDLTETKFVQIHSAEGGCTKRAILPTTHPTVVRTLGRMDWQVKLRGQRIELGEIESVAMEDQTVSEAAAVVHSDSTGEQVLLLYLTPADTDCKAVNIAWKAGLQSTWPRPYFSFDTNAAYWHRQA